jgi:hypothetical protein
VVAHTVTLVDVDVVADEKPYCVSSGQSVTSLSRVLLST